MDLGRSEIPQPLTASGISSVIDRFLQSFDNNDLDEVMEFFDEDSVYQVLRGQVCTGKAAIRAGFERQFAGAYGLLNFRETQRVIDEKCGTAALLWDCEHLLDQGPPAQGLNRVSRFFLKMMYRKSCHWQGVDIFEVTSEGKISSKRTYGHTLIPRLSSGVNSDSPNYVAK